MYELLLTASPAVLEARIAEDVLFPDDPDRDEAARRWRWAHRDRARRLEDLVPRTHRIDTTARRPSEVASLIAGSLSGGCTGPVQASPKARWRERLDRAADV